MKETSLIAEADSPGEVTVDIKYEIGYSVPFPHF